MATIPAMPPGAVTYISPDVEARAALAATPTRDLLRQAYALTHRMDQARRDDRRHGTPGAFTVVDLRAMRNLIDAEIERRTKARG